MTAKEMFEKLGYKEAVRDEEVVIYLLKEEFVYFNIKEKPIRNKQIGYGAYYMNEITGKKVAQKTISPKLHQAITQQMKELGWIE